MSKSTRLELQKIGLSGREGEPFVFEGAPLGASTSYRPGHQHATDYAVRGVRGAPSRWSEATIYRGYVTEGTDLETDPARPRTYAIDPTPGDYVVHTVGASIVPGEQRLSRISVTDSPFEVIEFLTVRPRDGEPFIVAQSSRALAQAAQLDDGIRDAYINRAVV